MFCIKCGNNLVEGSFFCNKCGAPVAGAGSQNNDNTGMRGNVDPAMQGNNGNMQNNVNPGMQMNNWNMQNNAYPNMRSNNRNIPNGANPYMPVNNGYMMPAGDAISKKTVLAILMIIGLFIALLSGIFHIYEEPDSWGEDTYNMFSVVGEYYSSKRVSIGYFGNGAFFSWVFGILFSIASLIGLVFPKVTDESKPGLIRVSSFLFIYSMLMIQIGLFIERITVNSRIYMNAWGWGLLIIAFMVFFCTFVYERELFINKEIKFKTKKRTMAIILLCCVGAILIIGLMAVPMLLYYGATLSWILGAVAVYYL